MFLPGCNEQKPGYNEQNMMKLLFFRHFLNEEGIKTHKKVKYF